MLKVLELQWFHVQDFSHKHHWACDHLTLLLHSSCPIFRFDESIAVPHTCFKFGPNKPQQPTQPPIRFKIFQIELTGKQIELKH
ncbi:hypothetical protein E4T56_gene14738 [Termitomyces sp. T112]|nr:hypothetical protein E4T56_gene14738 [Termitomyces sp. T112]